MSGHVGWGAESDDSGSNEISEEESGFILSETSHGGSKKNISSGPLREFEIEPCEPVLLDVEVTLHDAELAAALIQGIRSILDNETLLRAVVSAYVTEFNKHQLAPRPAKSSKRVQRYPRTVMDEVFKVYNQLLLDDEPQIRDRVLFNEVLRCLTTNVNSSYNIQAARQIRHPIATATIDRALELERTRPKLRGRRKNHGLPPNTVFEPVSTRKKKKKGKKFPQTSKSLLDQAPRFNGRGTETLPASFDDDGDESASSRARGNGRPSKSKRRKSGPQGNSDSSVYDGDEEDADSGSRRRRKRARTSPQSAIYGKTARTSAGDRVRVLSRDEAQSIEERLGYIRNVLSNINFTARTVTLSQLLSNGLVPPASVALFRNRVQFNVRHILPNEATVAAAQQ